MLSRHNPCRYYKYEEKAVSREQARGHFAQAILSMWQEGGYTRGVPLYDFFPLFLHRKRGPRGAGKESSPQTTLLQEPPTKQHKKPVRTPKCSCQPGAAPAKRRLNAVTGCCRLLSWPLSIWKHNTDNPQAR